MNHYLIITFATITLSCACMEKKFDLPDIISLALKSKEHQPFIEKHFITALTAEKSARDLHFIELQSLINCQVQYTNETVAAKPILLQHLSLAYHKLEKEHLEKCHTECTKRIQQLTRAFQSSDSNT